MSLPRNSSHRSQQIVSTVLVVLALALPAPATARLLFFESPLQIHSDLPVASRRLELVSSYFGAESWAGQRHTLRYGARRGELLSWSLGMPWLYSSFRNGGVSGRDNLQVSAALRLQRGDSARSRILADFWLPFAGEDLTPLATRRAFARIGLLVELGGEGSPTLCVSAAFRRELKGIGPDYEGPRWTDLASMTLRLAPLRGEFRTLFIEAGARRALDEDLTWWRIGAGVALDWNETWSTELSAEVAMGDAALPERYDYRVRLGISRTLPMPQEEAPPEPSGVPGGRNDESAPPSGG